MSQRFSEIQARRCRRPPLVAGLLAILLPAAAGCGSNPAYYRGDVTTVPVGSRVAVLPLVNLTRDENAADVVMSALVVELLATNRFTVVDPGGVEEEVQQRRLRLTDRLPPDSLQTLGAALAVDYVFVGTIHEFQMVRDLQEDIPTVSIALRMISCATGNIVWAATHSRRGDDTETMFRMGRIDTIEELTTVVAREMTRTCVPESAATPEREKKKP